VTVVPQQGKQFIAKNQAVKRRLQQTEKKKVKRALSGLPYHKFL
jgi:hypothetical protein